MELLEGASTVSEQQLVCSLDMIPQTGAHTGRLVPGDAVMTPWEPGVGRPYGPGLVTAVIEHQDSLNGKGRRGTPVSTEVQHRLDWIVFIKGDILYNQV